MSVRILVDGPARSEELKRRCRPLARRFLAELAVDDGELSIALVSDRRIRALKRRYLGLDEATDVLSFPAGDAPGPARPLGDIVISIDWTKRTARALKVPVELELARYLAHGLLHLLGFDHHTRAAERQMRALEDRLVGGPGMLSSSRTRGARA